MSRLQQAVLTALGFALVAGALVFGVLRLYTKS
jgi:hypothetical protein